jgi:VanZ family protein
MTLYILLSLAYEKLTIKIKVALLLAFGMLIEIVQAFIPGRDFSGFDVIADSVGITIGIVVVYMYSIYQRSSIKASS